MPVSGLSGMGKSFLFDHLIRLECDRLGVPYARIDLASIYLRAGYLHVLDELELSLRDTIASRHWKAYQTKRDEILRRLDSREISFQQRIDIAESSTGQNFTQRIDVGDALRIERKRAQDGVTDALARCLAHDQRTLVVFVDGWENVRAQEDPTLSVWLLEGLFVRLHRLRPATRLIIAGRQGFNYPSLQSVTLPCSELCEFSREDSVQFLNRRGITNHQVQQMVYDWVHGHPLLTAMLADQDAETLKRGLPLASSYTFETAQIIADWVRHRILAELPSQERDLLRHGVILRRFDLDALRALFPERHLDLDAFDRFATYSFVKRLERGWAFYDLVRQGQLHELREASEATYLDYHERALAHYEGRWGRERRPGRRRLWRLELLYHQFAVDESSALDAWWEEMRTAERQWEREWWRMLLELPTARELETSETVTAWVHLGWGKYSNQGAQWERALAHCKSALDLMEKVADLKGQAEAYAEIGDITFKQGQDWDQALTYLELSLDRWEQVGNVRGIVRACNYLGRLHASRSEWEQALRYLGKSRDLASEQDDRQALARALYHIGDVHFCQGEWDQALATYRHSLDLYKQINAPDGIIEGLNGIGQVYEGQGKWDEALAQFEESAQLCEEFGNELRRGETLISIGHVHEERGVWSTALEYYSQARDIAEGIGDTVGVATASNCLGEVNEVLGDLEVALADYALAWQHAERINLRHLMGTVACNLACTYLKQDKVESAAEEFDKSIAIQEEINNPRGLAACYNNLALLYHRQEMWGEAIAALQRSLAIKRDLGDIPGQIPTLYNLSRLHEQQGDIPKAVEIAELMIHLEQQIDHPALYGDLLRLEKLQNQSPKSSLDALASALTEQRARPG